MNIEMRFDLESARQYAETGRRLEWIKAFLTQSDRPNPSLWKRIVERDGFWVGPVEVPLRGLVRCFHPVQERVDNIARHLRHAAETPPLIVHSRIHHHLTGENLCRATFVYQLEIADGNHRHAAFEVAGLETCWALVELGSEHLE